MKILLFITVCFAACLADNFNGTQLKETEIKPVNVKYFLPGQILLPDYVCPDTLIVMDEETLNERFAFYEQGLNNYGDYELDSLLHSPNKQGLNVCMDFYQYTDFLKGEGYRQDIALHIAFVDFKILQPDSLYFSIMED
jgi:hypothetical protein